MKQALDFLPLIVFFIFFKLYDIYVGVTALMIASTLSLCLIGLLYRKIERMMLFTYGMVIIFGAMTLYFHNPQFIKWKVTLIYSLFALILLGSQWVFKKPLLQNLLGKEIPLSQNNWKKINFFWAVFFLGCAAANLYVTYYLSESAWATFKVFVLPAVTVFFIAISGVYIYKNNNDKM